MESVSFLQIGVFFACVVVVVGLAVGVKMLLHRDPALHREFATREQHAELKKEIEKLDTERRVSVARLHEKTETLSTDIAQLKSETTHQTRQLQSLDSKMDQVLMRLPRPNTK